MRRNQRAATCAFAFALMPAAARADAALPMIFVSVPTMIAALIPVIAIEAWIISRWGGQTFGKALDMSAASNLVSTLVGMPITWVIVSIAEFFFGVSTAYVSQILQFQTYARWPEYIFPAWIMPTDGFDSSRIHMLGLMLLFWFFWGSVFVERRVMRRMAPQTDPSTIDRACWYANIATYVILALVTLVPAFQPSIDAIGSAFLRW